MLTKTGEYALRAMVHFAQAPEARPFSASQIARATNTPQKYLSAVLTTLVRKRVLDATPGRGGGFSLARARGKIRLVEILEPFEAVLADRRPCPFGHSACSDEDPCAGHHRWKTVRAAFYEFVNGTTVLDLAGQDSAAPGQLRSKKKKKSAKRSRRAGRS